MIFLTGGSGLLGTELQKYIQCIAPSSNEFNILFQRKVPKETSLIVHCAAYTDVEKAETDRMRCYDTNVIGTANLAKLGIPIVYISTEYVFDGTEGNYKEDSERNPINYYAKTKAWEKMP